MREHPHLERAQAVLVATVIVLSVTSGRWTMAADDASALSEEPLPYLADEELPARPAPLLEIGADFLGAGNLFSGYTLPTGAVWQPAFWVFGDLRTAVQYFDNGRDASVLEWSNRLDLFGNLRLSGTERVLLGLTPLHNETDFSGYTLEPRQDRGFDDSSNLRITTLFFEGEFGEIFPNLDPEDTGALDIGFAVGRQPLFFQEGIMVNDTADAVGITRDTVMVRDHVIDWRFTGLLAWDGIHRDDNTEGEDAILIGLFTEADLRRSTVNLDFAYVFDDERGGGDGAYVGVSAIQRIGLVNTAFRTNLSLALDHETEAVSTGALLFAEVSTTLPHGHDVVYASAYWGIDNYSSAARGPTTGGPLGQLGILYAAVGVGRYGAALPNRADDSLGAAVGYQMFFNRERTQVIFEGGGRVETDTNQPDAVALGTRVQQAIGNRALLQVDGFAALRESAEPGFGLRAELLLRF